ncbi:hypothetical protein U1Q18_023887 [Sarracenia purpurea var. burkii]
MVGDDRRKVIVEVGHRRWFFFVRAGLGKASTQFGVLGPALSPGPDPIGNPKTIYPTREYLHDPRSGFILRIEEGLNHDEGQVIFYVALTIRLILFIVEEEADEAIEEEAPKDVTKIQVDDFS